MTSYSDLMKPLRRKCTYERLDNFKTILNQFFYGGKQVVPDDVMLYYVMQLGMKYTMEITYCTTTKYP